MTIETVKQKAIDTFNDVVSKLPGQFTSYIEDEWCEDICGVWLIGATLTFSFGNVRYEHYFTIIVDEDGGFGIDSCDDEGSLFDITLENIMLRMYYDVALYNL